jgi:hypothetical protein
MLKKRAMSQARWVDDVDSFLPAKRLETGYADNQPKWPYWVKPLNYSTDEWFKMKYWITETMGYSDWSVEHARWVGNDRKYWFRDERDRTMFILRWS